MIFGHNYLISEPIFKLSVAPFRSHELQKDDMVIFFLWRFRKVGFQKMQFLDSRYLFMSGRSHPLLDIYVGKKPPLSGYFHSCWKGATTYNIFYTCLEEATT